MSEAKFGEAFIQHEFDEAIAIQQAIVDGATKLAKSHPRRAAKQAITSALTEDREFLKTLKQLGMKHDATGKAEGVALALKNLMELTAKSVGEAPSEAYEAHAVLINLKRKQQDSAAAMVKIARETDDDELRDAAVEFGKATKASAQVLADDLALFAVEIATREPAIARR